MKHIRDNRPSGLNDQIESMLIHPSLPWQFLPEICSLLSDAVIILDGDQRIRHFNLSAAEMFGYLQEEALGKPLDLLIPPRYHETHRAYIRDFRNLPDLSRRMSERKPVAGLRKDGSEFPLEIGIAKYTYHDETFFAAIARDISDRVRAEERIRDQEQLYLSIITAMEEGVMLLGIDGQILTCNTSAELILGLSRHQITGRNCADPRWRAIHEDGSPLSSEAHPVNISLRSGKPQSNVIMGVHRPDGTLVWISMNSQPLYRKEDAKPHAVVTSFTDITERKEAQELLQAREKQLEQSIEERTRELHALLQFSNNLATTVELQPILELLLDQISPFAEYEQASIWIREDDSLACQSHKNRNSLNTEKHLCLPIAKIDDLWKETEIRRPLIQEKVSIGSDIARTFFIPPNDALEQALRSDGASWMAIPLVYQDHTIGLISLFHTAVASYSPHSSQVLEAIANQAAIAIQNLKLYAQIELDATRAERDRLARDLHDSVTQMLYSLTLFAEAAKQHIKQHSFQRVKKHLDQIGETAQQALREMRLLVYELRPPVLEQVGLVEALIHRVEAVERRAGVEARILVDELLSLPREVEEALYRIAQEALNNALKHASHGMIEVRLRYDKAIAELTIKDDGKGFLPSEPTTAAGGLGLMTMRERAEQIGGVLSITSEPDEGTTVIARIPVKDLA